MDLQQGLQRLGFQFVPFLVAVVVHEFGHGLAASAWGDHTAKEEGRLTLNPVPHIDPIGTVVFPIMGMVTGIPFLFGWAKPVPIDPRRFRKWRPGLFWTSLAGPLSNVICAFFFAVALALMVKFVDPNTALVEQIQQMLFYGVFINFGLGVFNLIPIPPLDGSKIVESFLPYDLQRKYESLSAYSGFILIGLILWGKLDWLGDLALFFGKLMLAIVGALFGVTFA